jgi:hypothetical protein
MKWLPAFIFGILIAAMVTGTGCMQPGIHSGPAVTSPPATQVFSLESMALTGADAPANFTLVERRAKTADEVAKVAKDLGWQGGYVVKYTHQPGTGTGICEITQSLVSYPNEAIPGIIETSRKNDMMDTGRVYSTLPSPGLGDLSIAFMGKSNANIVVHPDNNAVVLDSATGSVSSDMAEILFTRGSTLEVMRMSGACTDYSILQNLSKTAYARLP